jgi:hypothetical protein
MGGGPNLVAVARVAVLAAAAALVGCADAAPALEGVWAAQTARSVSWQIGLGNEGAGLIGRASYNNSGGPVFRDVPVYGPYPHVRYDVTVPPPTPTVPQLSLRFVFTGRVREDCNAERGACIRGSMTILANGQPAGPATWLDLYRVGP